MNRTSIPTLPVVATALVLAATDTSAAILIRAGEHTLFADQAGQTVTLVVDNMGPTAVPVSGFTLFLVIGGGGPVLGGSPVPTVTAVDLHTGTAFDGNFSPEVDQGSQDGVLNWYITPQSGNVTIEPGANTLATLTIDTTGFSPTFEPWALSLFADIPSFGTFATGYVLGLTEVPNVTLNDGWLELVAVPEPSEVALFAGLGLVGFGAWRRLRKP
jgi:hypothetical protein